MPAKTLYTGNLPWIEARFLENLSDKDPLEPRIVLCGSHLLGTYLRRRAAQQGATLFNVRFHTFDTLAADLLPRDYRKQKLISPLGELILLKKILRSRPGYFQPVHDKGGFLTALLAALQDLIDGGISGIPDSVQTTEKMRALAGIFAAYSKAILPFISRAGMLVPARANIPAFETALGTESLLVYGFYDFTFLQKKFLIAAAGKLNITAFLVSRPGASYEFAQAALHFFKEAGFLESGQGAGSSGQWAVGSDQRAGSREQGARGSEQRTGSRKQEAGASEQGAIGSGQQAARRRLPTAHCPPPTAHRPLLTGSGSSDLQRLHVNWGADDGKPVQSAPGRRRRGAREDRARRAEPQQPSLFNLDNEAGREEADGSVAILSVPDETAEITEICREIQNSARQGIDFSEMAVLLRNPEAYVPLILDLFKAYGIPCYVQSGVPLSRSHPARSLTLLLELLETAFPRFQVMEFATFAPLRWKTLLPEGIRDWSALRISTGAWDRLSMKAGVVSGFDDWVSRLARLSEDTRARLDSDRATAGEETPESGQAIHCRFEIFQLEALAAFIGVLDRWKQRFAECATWGALAACTREAMDTFFVCSDATWEQLKEVIRSIATLDQVDSRAELRDWIVALTAALENDRTQVGRFQDGGVSVLPVMGARGIRARVVLIPGMSEKGFPAPARQDSILLDRERTEINQARSGGELPLKLRRPAEEQLLFRLCLSAAQEKLVLSFPRLDIQTGRPRLPSHYLVGVAEALTGSPENFETMQALPQFRSIVLSRLAVADPAQALSDNEFSLAFLQKDPRRIPASLYASRLRCSLQAHQARWSRKFTPYDGRIDSPDSLALIAEWADRQHFSASRLEIFATCPFRFYLERLLRLEALHEPEGIVRISPLDRGGLVHEILETFMREARAGGWLPLKPQQRRELHELADRVAQPLFRRTEERGVTGYRLIWEMDTEQILEDLHTFVEKEIEREDDFIPDRFEVAFGYPPDPLMELTLPGGSRVSLRGRIDRIDVNRAGTAVRVVDYKTGKSHVKRGATFEEGKKLQLAIYLLAASELCGLGSPEQSAAEYYYVTSAGGFLSHPFDGSGWEKKQDDLLRLLDIINRAIRQGLFPPTPGEDKQNCKWCDYRLICDKRIDRIHSFKSSAGELNFQRQLEEYP